MIQLAAEMERIKRIMVNKSNAFQSLIYSIIAFVLLTTVAMLFYPGGKFFDHNSTGYSFFENFYSDLGRYKTFSGGNKYISTFFFIIAVFQMCWFIVRFFNLFTEKISERKEYLFAKRLTKISAATYGLLLSTTAVTPYDRLFIYHALSANLSFIVMIFVAVGVGYLTYKNKQFPKSYTVVFVLLALVLSFYMYLIFTVRSMVADANPYFHPTLQKIVVVCIIGSLVYLAVGCKKYLKTNI